MALTSVFAEIETKVVLERANVEYPLAHWGRPLASSWQPYSSRPRWD